VRLKKKKALRGCSANNWYQSEKILTASGDGGAMPPKPTTAIALDSMRDEGRQRKVEVAGAVRCPLPTGRGAMPRGRRWCDAAMRRRCDAVTKRRWCDAAEKMNGGTIPS
jgi:hypothetical protein